ncbi:PLP-dependent aminotransferase family protein [Cloacibacillus sp.]|uniref:aminotransferase-like domain-containing protein n=1 Tax=Cloacibacillus sp. TaxID=2049023 RepID=UPI0025C5FA9A|nr:PLP-dependent aminotransferase family protein [Cloacibacillus sp.]MCC8056613.1 PLP-dependent aminotransferase family protein [Cloacibacillus sp.]
MSTVNWDARLSEIALNVKPSPIRALLKYTKTPGVISFAGGNPDPAVFPVAEFAEASQILSREGKDVLQYGATNGYDPLKEYISKWMAPRMGRETKLDEMLITTGSQEGMDLLCSVLLNDGDTIIVEGPTYPGALHVMRNRGARFLSVPCDKDGLCVDLLPGVIEQGRKDGHKIKFIYSIVNFQNPSGATLSKERRAKLLEIAEKYDLIIFEDDPYGHLRYNGEHVPTIFSMDKSGRVVYACSFSKILAPGTRVAWIVGAPELIQKMVMIKQGTNLCTSVVAQALVYEYCRLGHLDGFLPKIIAHYSKKRDAMDAAFKKHLPANTRYHTPEGGFFFWLQVPGVDSTKLFMKAIDHGVAFVTGPAFYAEDGEGLDYMRTCFTFAQPEEIEEGAKRLAAAIKEL